MTRPTGDFPKHRRDGKHEEDGGVGGVKILHDELKKLEECYGSSYATDDVTGAWLDAKMVKQARQLEMEYLKRMGVYSKIPRKQTVQRGGKSIQTRWIDGNKGDESSPDYRSRLVGKEYSDGVDPSFYAATPLLKALRFILSQAATGKWAKSQRVMIDDVKRQHFHAKVTRHIYVGLPQEDREEGLDQVGRLELCLYGTRDAATNWQETVAVHLEGLGFIRGVSIPCVFANAERGILALVHGSDYASTGESGQLRWLQNNLEDRFEIKRTMVGPGRGRP